MKFPTALLLALGSLANSNLSIEIAVPLIQSRNKQLLNLLDEISTTTVFKYFKANLHKDCKFWDENQLCNLRDCTVVEAQEDEVPEKWRKQALSDISFSPLNNAFHIKNDIQTSDYCVVEDELDEDGTYINLLENPERYTGYAGESAAKVWSSIYSENCFGVSTKNPWKQNCHEEQIFYRLVSGLHSSISMHICGEWLDRSTGIWIKNDTCFDHRFSNFPERIDNLYLLWTVMERAATKASYFLKRIPYTEGTDDAGKVKDLLSKFSSIIREMPSSFDESTLFQNDDFKYLRNGFKNNFRNISRIMDCVGCQKCRLWGKIQTIGLGTALKILFSFETSPKSVKLNRQEVVAFINTFHKFSESIALVEHFNERKKFIAGLNTTSFGYFYPYSFYIGGVVFVLGIVKLLFKYFEMTNKHKDDKSK